MTTFKPSLVAIGVLALGSVMAFANAPAPSQSKALTCGIQVHVDGNRKTVSALVESPNVLNANYQLRIKGSAPSGSTNISQGGGFSLAQNTPHTVSTLSVSADAKLAIDFTITAAGVTHDCSNEITYKS